jgi:4-amino-4-deoxy-L-arabinose transferase-like glycosyltransferase
LGRGFGAAAPADQTLIAFLKAHKGNASYLVATFGSQSSAPIIIATGQPVITIGGFSGGDPAPTLAQFEKLVAQGKVRYVLVQGGGDGGGPGRGNSTTQAISQWATTHGRQVLSTNSGTVYDVSG